MVPSKPSHETDRWAHTTTGPAAATSNECITPNRGALFSSTDSPTHPCAETSDGNDATRERAIDRSSRSGPWSPHRRRSGGGGDSLAQTSGCAARTRLSHVEIQTLHGRGLRRTSSVAGPATTCRQGGTAYIRMKEGSVLTSTSNVTGTALSTNNTSDCEAPLTTCQTFGAPSGFNKVVDVLRK
jgi:hypothetical protein